jgi:UPF0176 protein
VQVAAFYGFAALVPAQLPALRQELLALASAAAVRGTILLAEEGVNGTISGQPAGVAEVLARKDDARADSTEECFEREERIANGVIELEAGAERSQVGAIVGVR